MTGASHGAPLHPPRSTFVAGGYQRPNRSYVLTRLFCETKAKPLRPSGEPQPSRNVIQTPRIRSRNTPSQPLGGIDVAARRISPQCAVASVSTLTGVSYFEPRTEGMYHVSHISSHCNRHRCARHHLARSNGRFGGCSHCSDRTAPHFFLDDA